MSAEIPVPEKNVEERIVDAYNISCKAAIQKYRASRAEVNQQQRKIAAQHNYLLAEGERIAIIRSL